MSVWPRPGRGNPLRPFSLLARFLLLVTAFAFTMISSTWAEEKRYDVSPGDAPFLGPADAPLTIIEFIDFQ